tara:strand:- start:698 stop:799 length:102 start_codon:yes stop_codon:yes gene_type:complete
MGNSVGGKKEGDEKDVCAILREKISAKQHCIPL